MLMRNHFWKLTATILIGFATSTLAQSGPDAATTADRRTHEQSAKQHEGSATRPVDSPALPEGMSLDDVFDYAESPPPADYPDPVPDDEPYAFTLFEQLEYRIADDQTPDHLGWEAQGWLGGDFNKFWWKNEGQAVFEGADEGESETDLLYSRLITPFWNLQLGAQYANEWTSDDYDDRWSAALGVQGLAPGKVEVDSVLYVSEDADLTAELEAEYDIRVTQRWVLQPRAELGLAAQDIPERDLGAGVTDTKLDLRLRYEIKREVAPYVGVRYQTLLGETDNRAEAAGEDTEQLFFLTGVRLAF